MRTTVSLLLLLFSVMSFTGRAQSCTAKLDSAGAVKIAIKKKAWSDSRLCKPSVKFDGSLCEWTVVSARSRHTDKGDCKYTNGCTEVITTTLVIDARNGKVKHRLKKSTLYHNYE